MKELTEANRELQELIAGSSVPEVSTHGSDVVSPMTAAMEQLLFTLERAWGARHSRTVEGCSSR